MKMLWIIYAFVAMLCLTVMVLIETKVTRIESSSILINMYIFGLAFIGFLFLALRGGRLTMPSTAIYLLVIVAVIAVAMNFFAIESLRLAPNPGYPKTIKALSAVLVTLFAVVFLGSKLTMIKFISVLVTILGIVMLILL